MEVLNIHPNSSARLAISSSYVRLAAVSMDLESAEFNPLNYIMDESFLWLKIKGQRYFVTKLDTRPGKNGKQVNLLLSNSEENQISFENKGRFRLAVLLELLQGEGKQRKKQSKPKLDMLREKRSQSVEEVKPRVKREIRGVEDFPLWDKISSSSEEGARRKKKRRFYYKQQEEEEEEVGDGSIFSLLGKKKSREKFTILK